MNLQVIVGNFLAAIVLCACIVDGKRNCEDSPSLGFPRNGKVLNCQEFISQYPCQCRETFKLLSKTVTINKECCKSCAAADLSECDCQNIVSASQPITVGDDISIESCEQLATDWPELCERFGNKKNTPCCKACKAVSTGCLDSNLIRFDSETTNDLTCAEYIAEDLCNCAVAKDNCCESCKDFDISKCCLNDPKYKATVKIRRNGKKIKCKKCSCDDLLKKDVFLMKKACDNNVKGAKKRCCKNCAVINPNP